MDDLISRQAANNALENTECELLPEEWDELTDAIMNVPSAQQWIPVTERLPEDDTICILTNGVSNAIGYRGKAFGWHLIWTDYVAESDVTHWMPLPEPQQEVKE